MRCSLAAFLSPNSSLKPCEFDFGVGHVRLARHPAFEQAERLLRAAFLGQQHGQSAITGRMVFVAIEAEIVVVFGHFQIGRRIVLLAHAMVSGRHIVIGVGVRSVRHRKPLGTP